MLAFESFLLPLNKEFQNLFEIHEAWKNTIRPLGGLIQQALLGIDTSTLPTRDEQVMEYAVSALVDQLVNQPFLVQGVFPQY